MAPTLTTHDTRFDQLDETTIARVLASLDGDRNVLATLERSDLTYLQAEGGVHGGFVLEYQDGALDQRYRSREHALPLGQVTAMFQMYARGDGGWRGDVAWEHVPFVPIKTSWVSSWWFYVAAMVTVGSLIWWWRG